MSDIESKSPIEVGGSAPLFTAPALTREGEIVFNVADYKDNQAVVLYFYPKDDTPGCTKEACAFRDLREQFHENGAEIIGVSVNSIESHIKFAEKYTLPFPLVSDPDHAIAELFGAWKEKKNYGKVYWGVQRSTFLIDKKGVIRKIWPNVKVDLHAEKVLEEVKAL
jgi:peroxiredoxin Q/BCP